ncbi:branched-chain amino acid ABC transporter permease [Actinomadura sp. NBRC 104412]|uniref:branched-chain amino acid ABC transporter permease n=1 Tax=Actinomadura sp. NBRC 104412 TaxID=3032203 RepID=UPI0024A0F92D|nr:branched-chain amino acid ABC transporter permease [Actinomadura sp. NBRC 104412]GLZ02706.1 branched-chain amino acid ABC transporter permease [Actinomadura sp. NBRC 104412]
MDTVQAALTGVLVGGLYALMAAGLSITWGVLRIINLIHFGLILLGAYLTFQLASSWGMDPILTVVVTAPTLFALGAAVQWGFDRLGISELNSLLLSFGLLIVIVQGISNLWSADYQQMTAAANPYATRSIEVGSLVFPLNTLLAFVLAIVLIGGAHMALRRTFTGRALRAFAQDRAIAAAFGIDHRRIGLLLAGAAGATAAAAGMLFALSNALTPATAFEWFGTVFAVVILGGIGHLVGTLVAGLLVGALGAVVTVVVSPAAEPFVLFSVIILVLLLRPQGLFAHGGTR